MISLTRYSRIGIWSGNLQTENQELARKKTKNFLDTYAGHVLCFDLSAGYKGVHICKPWVAHSRLTHFMHFTVCVSHWKRKIELASI